MCRGWMGVVLVAACCGLSVPARAQNCCSTYPSPVGAARMPEPIPCGPALAAPPAPPPNLVPGPVSPLAAPMGPPDCLSLPADHSSAFQCENYLQDSGFFAHIGPMALQRNKLGAGDIAVVNASSQGQLGPIFPNPFGPAPAGSASALNFNSFTPALSLGIRGTLGYLWGNQSIDYETFYIWENDVNTTAMQRNAGLDTLFYNPPLTFLDTGIRRASQVSTSFGSSLWNNEVNYRRWNQSFGRLEFIFGVRYLRQNDILGISWQSPLDTFGTDLGRNFSPDRHSATYSVLAHNNIFAPQIGGEYSLPLTGWMAFSVMGKAAWGANYITTDVSLKRGDGLVGFDTQRTAWSFGEIYTLGAFVDFLPLDRLRLRLGYTSTWLVGVAAANDQVNFNLQGSDARQVGFGVPFNSVQQTIQHGNLNTNGSMIYFGPQIELQFFF